MTTPTSPLDKKTTIEERELTLEERVGRLEFTLERAYNVLTKQTTELEMGVAENFNRLQGEVTQAITVLNLSNLQNIITIRELVRVLAKSATIDEKSLNETITAELKKAVQEQQEILQKMQDEAMAKAMAGTEKSALEVTTEPA